MPGRLDQYIKKTRGQQRLNVMVMISGGVLIMAALLMMPFFRQIFSFQRDFIHPPRVVRPFENSNAMGDSDAPVVIQEFSDFGCAHCRTFAFSRAEKIAADYVANGQVYFVFNSVGSMLGHPNSVLAAEAAYCAAEQDRFWDYHDFLYANQTALFANINQNINPALFYFAEALSMDLDRFQACLDQDTTLPLVQADQMEAYQANIMETPSFTINGELFQGDWTKGDLEVEIEAALKEVVP